MRRTHPQKPCTPGDCTSQGFIRDIYFRQDRPASLAFLECDTVEEANNVMAEFPLAKAGLLTFECIPLGSLY